MAKLFVSNKDESARLFHSSFLELFTHVHWSVPIIVYLPVVVYSVYVTSTYGAIGASSVILLFVAGLVVWTLAEYLLHRFVFHYEPKSGWGKRLHFLMHGVHHDYPQDSKRLVMPPVVSIPLALLFLGAFILILPAASVGAVFGGFIFGYICYDEIHYATHHAPMKGKLGLWLKHHHVRHHYLDPGRGFGVSSPIWDYVFGTMYSEKEDLSVEGKEI
ncbi:MAG TPA: sterol desaturase family protein [Bacteroidota bacterium]|nr:sterol desaturase family protein [Bacteroidota bacterium]